MYQNYSNLNTYNPYAVGQMQPQYDRLQQMQQMQQQMQPQQQVQQVQQPSVIPVASIEEVRAYAADWSGNVQYFTDKASNKIYTKQIGLDGIPMINAYGLEQVPTSTKEEFVNKEEFNALKIEIESYKKILNEFLGGVSNGSNANDADDARGKA